MGSIVLSGAVSAATLANTPQPKFHHDNNNTGQSQYQGPQTNSTKWKYETLDHIDSSPAIGADGTIYFGTLFRMNALSPTGTMKWRYQTSGNIQSSPAVGSDGTVYFGCADNYLYALDPTGTLKWRYQVNSVSYSSPAIGSDGTIYIGSTDSYLYAINPTGTLKWRYQTGGGWIESSPAIGSDGTIYIGSNDNYLHAITPTGTLKWKYYTGSIMKSSPAIGSDGTIYIGSGDYYLYAITSTGSLKWRYYTGGVIDSSPAIGSDGTLYFGCYDGYLYALNPTGALKWRYYSGGWILSSPAIGSDGTIYYGCSDYNLYALNPTGTLKWKYQTGNNIYYASPIIGSDNTLYAGSMDGTLYAITDIAVSADPAGGSYTNTKQVTLTKNLPGTIYYEIYTSNYNSGWTTYTKPIIITKSCNISFYAVDYSGNTSPLYTEAYTVNCPAPSITSNPTGGVYTNAKKVILTTTSSGTSTTYYTTDGTDPQTSYSRHTYTVPLIISSDTTLRFSALDLEGNWSPNYTETYIIDTSVPTITANPTGGIYNTTKTVTLTTNDPDSPTTTYYTTDGTDPQNSGTRRIYTSPLIISTTTTLRFSAIDVAGNWGPNYKQTYTIDKIPPKVVSTTPTNNKTGVSKTSTITIKFSENIKSSTYFNNITIKNMTTGKKITISLKSLSGNSLNIKTSTRSANTWYLVTIPKGAVKDYAGNNLQANYIFRFKTGNI